MRASAAAAPGSDAAAARVLRRKDRAPVTTDQESFTAVRHQAVRSMTSSQITASSSLAALTAAADAAARAALTPSTSPAANVTPSAPRRAGPKFRHTSGTKQTITGKPQVTVFAPSPG